MLVHVLWPNGNCMDQDETWHTGRPRPWPHRIRWGPSSPSSKGAHPQFSAHVCCGQMAGWIKMPLGMEVGLGPGDFVLHGNPAPSPKRGQSPQVSAHVYCGETAGWIKMALGVEIGLGQGHMMRTQIPSRKEGQKPPNFRPISIVTKRLDGSRCNLIRR